MEELRIKVDKVKRNSKGSFIFAKLCIAQIKCIGDIQMDFTSKLIEEYDRTLTEAPIGVDSSEYVDLKNVSNIHVDSSTGNFVGVRTQQDKKPEYVIGNVDDMEDTDLAIHTANKVGDGNIERVERRKEIAKKILNRSDKIVKHGSDLVQKNESLEEDYDRTITDDIAEKILDFFNDQKFYWENYPDVLDSGFGTGNIEDGTFYVELDNSNPTYIADTNESLDKLLPTIDPDLAYEIEDNDNGFYGMTYRFFFYEDSANKSLTEAVDEERKQKLQTICDELNRKYGYEHNDRFTNPNSPYYGSEQWHTVTYKPTKMWFSLVWPDYDKVKVSFSYRNLSDSEGIKRSRWCLEDCDLNRYGLEITGDPKINDSEKGWFDVIITLSEK